MLTASTPNDGVIALNAPWNALPRKPQIADPTQQVYVDAVRDFLKDRRISDPEVKITRILRVDLDGDGEEEVLKGQTEFVAGELYVKDVQRFEFIRDSGRARSKRRRQARGYRPLTLLRRRGDHDLGLLRRKAQSCAFRRVRSVTEGSDPTGRRFSPLSRPQSQ